MSDNLNEELKKKAVAEAERLSKIFEDTKTALQTEERFVNFLMNYHPDSVKSFIEHYARQKSYWYGHADDMHRFRTRMNGHYYDIAMEQFKDIYLKKLFNIQCRWVSGEMDLPGIELSSDFNKFINEPESCTFVEPITSREFECFMQFKQLGNWLPEVNGKRMEEGDDNYYNSAAIAITFYHRFRSNYTKRDIFECHPWFYFYDKCFNTESLLDLPALRTDLEQEYEEIWDEEIHTKTLTPEQLKNRYFLSRADRKLHLENPELHKAYIEEENIKYKEEHKNDPEYLYMSTYDRKLMDELVPLLEDREVVKYYKANDEWRRRLEWGERIEMTVIYLQKAKEYIPIESNDDYREAIKKANKYYENKMVMELLPLIFEKYCKCMSSGIAFEFKKDQSPHADFNSSREHIIEARIWKGEPGNLDFLKKENLITKN